MFQIKNSGQLQPSSSVVQGEIWTLLAFCCLVAFTTIGEYFTQEMSVQMITFFRFVFGLLFIAPRFFVPGLVASLLSTQFYLFPEG